MVEECDQLRSVSQLCPEELALIWGQDKPGPPEVLQHQVSFFP